LKNDLFAFPKVKRLRYTGKVVNYTRFDVKFPHDFTRQKSLKSTLILTELFEK